MKKPNLLIFMVDQMQGRVLRPDHPCITPNIDALMARGTRFERAYTPNPICSPARASFMTGCLPHTHGVDVVTHTVDKDRATLREKLPHWAQRFQEAGYQTSYTGKWHIERTSDLTRFGWQHHEADKGFKRPDKNAEDATFSLEGHVGSRGYPKSRFYGVFDLQPEERYMGTCLNRALKQLDKQLENDEPWCSMISIIEPHDPFYCHEEAYALYDPKNIPLANNVFDSMSDKPGLYRESAKNWSHFTEKEYREAAMCYYASITEIDTQFARVITKLENAGVLDDTLIVFLSDHGEALGAHGMFNKNIGPWEESYNIPLIMAGPGVAKGKISSARVGTHDLAPTLLEYAGLESIGQPESKSFAELLPDPQAKEHEYVDGYAEYYGGRMILSQRVLWHDHIKYVFNGFDQDELYDLEKDPGETINLVNNSSYDNTLKEMCRRYWKKLADINDHTLLNSNYPSLRVASYGPDVV